MSAYGQPISWPRYVPLHPGRAFSGAGRQDPAHKASPSHGQAPVQWETPATILIVDDDPMLLETLADLIGLRMPNAKVLTCLSGADAVTMVTAIPFHAIVTDLKMPDMDGLTLITKIQAIQPYTPVLMITGHGDHALQARADELGAFAFILKPLDRNAFMVTLQQALFRGDAPRGGRA